MPAPRRCANAARGAGGCTGVGPRPSFCARSWWNGPGRPCRAARGQGALPPPEKHPAAAAIVVADAIHDAGGRPGGRRVSGRLDAGQKAHRQKHRQGGRISCAPNARRLIRPCFGSGISNSRGPRRRSAPPRATRACGQSFTQKKIGCQRISWCAFSPWRYGAASEQWMLTKGYSEGPGHLRAPTGQGSGDNQKHGRDPASVGGRGSCRTAPAGRLLVRAGHRPIARPPRAVPAQRPSNRHQM